MPSTTWGCGHSVHLGSKDIPQCHFVGVCLVEGPPKGQACAAGISGGLVRVDKRLAPESVAETSSIAVNITV